MTQPEPISRGPTLSEQVADRIAAAIMGGEFIAGDRLVEAKLAARYGVSRGPVREALQLLGSQGLVEVRGSKGAYVRTVSTEELERMIVLRSTLEGLAARIVAVSGTEDQLAQLEQISREVQHARERGDVAQFRAHHAAFHRALCEFAGYSVVSSWWEVMRNLERVFHGGWSESDAEELADVREDIRVLRQRDPDLAERHLRARTLSEGYRRLGLDVPAALKSYLKK